MKRKEDIKSESCMPDKEIIDLYWQRNEKAISETDRKYGKYLFTIAYNIVHDRLDCEECVNDTYLGTWNRIPPTSPNVFQVFLSKIIRNIAIDRYRKNSASRRIPSEMLVSLEELDECIPNSMSVEEEYAVAKLSKILNSFLRELSDRSEFVFVCRYYYADRISDISQMLHISENTVYRELSRMRQELQQRLEKEGYGNE